MCLIIIHYFKTTASARVDHKRESRFLSLFAVKVEERVAGRAKCHALAEESHHKCDRSFYMTCVNSLLCRQIL